MKASGQTEGDVQAFAAFEAGDLCRIMPLIREKHSDEPQWNPGTPDEFALNMLRNSVMDASMAYRTRGLLGSSWKSYGRLSQAAQGKFEGHVMQTILVSRVRLSARAGKFNETFNDRPVPTTKEEAEQGRVKEAGKGEPTDGRPLEAAPVREPPEGISEEKAWLLADWFVRDVAAIWVARLGLDDAVALLKELPEVRSSADVPTAPANQGREVAGTTWQSQMPA